MEKGTQASRPSLQHFVLEMSDTKGVSRRIAFEALIRCAQQLWVDRITNTGRFYFRVDIPDEQGRPQITEFNGSMVADVCSICGGMNLDRSRHQVICWSAIEHHETDPVHVRVVDVNGNLASSETSLSLLQAAESAWWNLYHASSVPMVC